MSEVGMSQAVVADITMIVMTVETKGSKDKPAIAETMTATEIHTLIDTGGAARKRWTNITEVSTKADTKAVEDTDPLT